MADIPFDGAQAPQEQAETRTKSAVQALGTATNWAGAAVSLGLIVGIGIWGYKTLARDVTGVPVVRAASGLPMRVQPEDPGGAEALNQGLAVNKVAAEGAAEKPADRLVLAPAPLDLDQEDKPTGAGVAVEQASAAADAPAAAVSPPKMDDIRALADRLAADSAPLAEESARAGADENAAPEKLHNAAATVPAVEAPAAETIEAAVAAAKPEAKPKPAAVKGGLKRSLRPVTRPSGLRKAAAAAPAQAAATALDLDPATIPAGTRLAQLGAFDSPETARSEWAKLEARFGDYLEGKKRVIQKASSGGRTFYRLRAVGFADMSDARRFCSALVAERADCIPVTAK